MADYGLESLVYELNVAAARVARSAVDAFSTPERPRFVAGVLGPTNKTASISPRVEEPEFRDITFEALVEDYCNATRGLLDGGADAIIIETQTSFEELDIAIAAAKEAGAPCVIGSMAYDVTTDGSTFRTMMGIDPEQAAEFMAERGVDILGLNCGTGMDMARAREGAERYRSACDLPVMTQANAGQPELENLIAVYKETPEEMVQGFPALLDAGVNIIGACCGSTPEHIRAFRTVLDQQAELS